MNEPLKTVGPFILIPPFKQQIMTEAQQRAYDQAKMIMKWCAGEKLEFRQGHGEWKPLQDENILNVEFRIAPEPQEVWLWVKEGQSPCTNAATTLSGDMQKLGYTKKLFREVLP